MLDQGLAVIIDDCESAANSGSPSKTRGRVWPVLASNCMIVPPFNGMNPGSDGKTLSKVLEDMQAIHQHFFKSVGILNKDSENPSWLDKTLEKRADGKKTCPMVADALLRVMKSDGERCF